jgi:RNA polymerase sigma factor (sigma-70 family)
MDAKPAVSLEELLAHAGWLRALASSLVRDSASAEDLVQDTWLVALTRRPRSGRPLRPWLARVVRNLASNRRRAEGRRTEHELDARLPSAPQPAEEIVVELEAQRALVEVLLALEEPLRSTVVLRYFRGFDASQIAKQQGVPAGTVRWRLKRAIDELRERLDARFGGSRANWCALLAPLALRPDALLLGTGGAIGAGAVAPGVVAMSAVAKVGLAAAVLAGASLWWWGTWSGGSAVSPQPAVVAQAPKSPVPAEIPPQEPDSKTLEAAGGSNRSEVQVEVPAPAPPAIIAPEPAPAGIDARFVDESGAPWHGVRFAADDLPDVKPVTSAPNGHAELVLPWSSKNEGAWALRFSASRSGCATAVVHATLHPGETTHLGDVVLGPGITLHGRVVDERKRPFPGARVGVTTAPVPTDALEVGRAQRHGLPEFLKGPLTASGEDGSFQLEGVAPGPMRAWTKAEGMRYAWSEPFETRAGEDVYDIELTITPFRAEDHIAGRVVDPDGRPVPGASLSTMYRAPVESGTSSTVADREGHFKILVTLAAPYRFEAWDRKGRYAPASVDDVQPGTLDLVLQLGELRYLETRVRDARGEPVAHSTVVSGRADRTSIGESRAEGDSDGVARIAVPSYPFVLQASAPGFRAETRGPFDPQSPPERVEFELQALPVLRGRVVAAGEPVAGAEVELRKDMSDTLVLVNEFQCVMMPYSLTRKATTGAEGRFELGAEEPGRYWIRALADGLAPGDLGPFELDVGIAQGEVELVLTHGGAIEGRVSLPDGRDGEGTVVGVNHGDGAPRTQRAGPGGRFRFEGLTPGKWQVLAREKELPPPELSSSRFGGNAPPIEWSCEVIAGRTTRHDLDLTAK